MQRLILAVALSVGLSNSLCLALEVESGAVFGR